MSAHTLRPEQLVMHCQKCGAKLPEDGPRFILTCGVVCEACFQGEPKLQCFRHRVTDCPHCYRPTDRKAALALGWREIE